MFEDYMYVSGTSPILKKHFENYFKRIKNTIRLNKNTDNILDIACNDGTFLEFFKKNTPLVYNLYDIYVYMCIF